MVVCVASNLLVRVAEQFDEQGLRPWLFVLRHDFGEHFPAHARMSTLQYESQSSFAFTIYVQIQTRFESLVANLIVGVVQRTQK